MNKKLLFITFLMLFCTTVFGEGGYWQEPKDYHLNMLLNANIKINGEVQNSDNLEIAAFCNGEIRGTTKTTIENGESNVFFTIGGNNNGEKISLKLYVPGTGNNEDKVLGTDYTLTFMDDAYIGFDPLLYIDFYEKHWDYTGNYENSMTVECTIIIDDVTQERTDLELAAFCGNELRGVAKPQKYQTASNEYLYLTALTIGGNDGERIDFKVYDPIRGIEIPTEYFVNFVTDETVGNEEALSIEFITTPYVAQVGDKKYQSLEKALKALTEGSTLTILEDITISEKWDNRYTGAKVSVPVTIYGNGKTIKFTGEINDDANYTAAFRFEAAATIKNLKIDMSEAISSFPQRLSAVAAKLDITVDACTFIGNANYDNTKAIIFGEGAQDALADVIVNITNSHFIDWKYGVSDNQNAQDAKNVTIAKNIFQNASVNVSASEFVMFDENKLYNGNVTITSYTNNTALKVEAIKNTLDATKENSIKVDPTDKINAQEGILLPVAKIGSKYYLELNKAFAAAKAGDVVTVFEGTYAMPSMKAGITVEGKGNVLFEGTLKGSLENLTMKNIHIKGSNAQRWAYAKGDLVFENVTFEATSVYALHFDGITEGATLTYKDCTIIGWAAMSGSPASCIFDGCTIKGNGTYGLIRTYFDATIKDCTFDVANVNTTDVYQDGIHAVGETTTVTVTNCTNSRGEMIDLVNVSGYSVVDLDGTKIMNVAKIAETEKHYWTVTEAINAAQSGQTVELLAREINEAIAPWAGDAQHTSEKSITIVGAENFGTTLTGGLYLGYDDSGCRAHTITIEGIAFEGKGILVAGQQNVVIEGNKFTNITELVATSQSANANAISVIGKKINATVKNNVIDNIAVAGINLRDIAYATVEGNTITNTKHNAITITETAGEGRISVKNNKLSQWGSGEEKGRAIRISANKDVYINSNVMSYNAAPESFVKVTGLGTEEKTLNVDRNYWNGNNPIALFETDGKKDPVSYLLGYYKTYEDNTLKDYVELSASVAKIGDKYYQTLEAALEAAAQSGDTIELLADIEASEVIEINKSLTINGNSHKVTSNATRVFRLTTSNIEVTLNNVNMVSRTVMTYPNDIIRGISIDPSLSKVKMTLNSCSVDFTDASACDWAYAVNVSDNGTGHTVIVNGGTYEGANVINVHGASNTIVVKNATLISMYPNNDVYYGSCIWVLQNQGSSVEATGNTFNGSNAVAFNLGTGTALTESNNTDNTTICVAKIGNVYYTSLVKAFEDAQDGNTIKVLQNIALSESITNTKKVTLDLNGKTIAGTDNATASFGLITNKGELTITGEGKITLKATNDRDWNAYSSVISNQPGGKLIVENGTIEHLGGTDMAYGIDNLTNGKGTYAETVVNGGTVKSTYRAIRQFLNGIEAQNILTVNGGTIEGANKSIWMQDPSAKANSGKLTVGANASLKGDVYLFVTAGSTEWPVEVAIASAALKDGAQVLTGNVPETYVVKEVNGTWRVFEAVAKIGNTSYQTLAEAVAAATDGATITMLADVNEAVTISGKTITLDLNGKKVYSESSDAVAVSGGANVTIKNGTLESAGNNCGGVWVKNATAVLDNCTFVGTNSEQSCGVYASNGAIVTIINNCKLEANHYGLIMMSANVTINSGTFTAPLSVSANGSDDYDDATLTINDGTFNGGIYWPANGKLTINGGTFTDETALYIKSGSLEINGGTFTGNGVAKDYAYKDSGFDATGAAIVIENIGVSEYDAIGTVSITGGTFISEENVAIQSVTAGNEGVAAIDNFITGGTFSSDVNALCAPAYTCKANNDGTYSVVEGLDGSGTEADPFLITNLTELEYFKASVNAGETTYNQEGVWVALGADIDMTSVANWAPIGSFDVSYDGNFNGQGHKIMNLKMSDDVVATGESYLGFFGVTANNVIKNFVIENVTIESEGQIVAAAIAYPYYTTVSDITVCGDIAIEGGNYTAGVLAYTRHCVNASNLTVSGNSGSYITGAQVVGGVIADIQMNGGVANYSNFSASGLEITGTMNVGGISGIISGQTLNGATVKNVTLNCSDARVGVVSGSMGATSTISTIDAENVTGATAIIGATYDNAKAIEARIGDTYYATLEAALLAEGNNVTLLVPYVVEAGEEVVLDLNGKRVTGTPTEAKAYAVITNRGNLTITNGSIICNHTLDGSTGYAVNTIVNCGTLTIDGATVENKSTVAYQIGYAIDNNSTSANAILVVKAGVVKASGSNYYDGIRQFCNSMTNENSVTINGGEVSSLWMQNPSDGSTDKNTKNVKGSFLITGGEVDYVYTEPSTEFTASITGGTFVKVAYNQEDGVRDLKNYITGGAFVNDPSAFVAVDYSAVYDGEYFIVRLTSGTQTREFASAGWYWFSTYINLNANGENSLDIFKSAFVDDNNFVKVKQIKGQDGYVGYNSAYGIWTNGGLMAITNTDMYMINMKEAHTINLTGEFAEEGYEIPLNEGWNWIGYPVREEINVTDALANLTPKEGDAFKSQNKSAYFTGGAWRIEGGWDRMIPGQGYKYYRKPGNGNTSLIYSTEVKPSSESDDNRGINHWVANATKYPGNMTVIAMLNIDGEAASDNYEVAAFANGECRGSARPFYVEEMDAYVMIMTINGEEVEELTFKCYDVNYGTEYELSNRFNYSDDAILGSIDEPYMFFMNTLGIEESSLNDVNIYPNPTTTDRAINLQATCDNVEVFNALGVKVAEYQNVDTIDALETAGVYVIRVTINGEVKNCRLVVK